MGWSEQAKSWWEIKWKGTVLVIFRSSLSRDIGPKRQIVTEMPSKCTCSTQIKICAVTKGFVTLYTCSFTSYNHVGLTIKTRQVLLLVLKLFPFACQEVLSLVSCAVSRVCTLYMTGVALYQQWSKVIQDTSCYSCPGIHLCIKRCWLVRAVARN